VTKYFVVTMEHSSDWDRFFYSLDCAHETEAEVWNVARSR
jgi:hypothetical protein